MKRKLFVAVGLFAASLLLVPATAWAEDGEGTWEIEGTWLDGSAAQDYFGLPMTITRTGGNEYQMVTDYAGIPLWPDETRRSIAVGPLWKVGPHTFAWTQINYIIDEDGWPAWTMVSSGTFEMVSPDRIVTTDYYIALYGPGKDALYIFGGGPPDILNGPYTGGMRRIPHLSVAPPAP